MRRIGAAFAAVLAGLLCTGAGPAPRPPTVITEPDWISRPNGEDFARAYPPVAWKLGVGARAVVECLVDDQGRLRDCRIVSETPAGLGFGAAALSMTSAFHMRPMTRNGEPVGGCTVRIPIRFMTRELKRPAPIGQPEGARALALARELMELSRLEASLAEGVEREIRDLDFIPRRQLSDAARELIASALRARAPAYVSRVEGAHVQLYASLYTAKELAATLAFERTPLGAGFARQNPSAATMQQTIAKIARPVALARAREVFCAQTSCDPSADRIALLKDADGPRPVVGIPNPVWAASPDPVTLVQARPRLATEFEMPGRARLTCKVQRLGGVANCVIANETPEGLGFGVAALTLASRYRLAPSLLAQGAEGESVAVIVEFPAPPASEPAAVDLQPRSSRSAALAREMILASEDVQAQAGAWRARLTQPDMAVEGVSPEQLDRLLTAVEAGSAAATSAAFDVRIASLSQRFSDAELAAGVRFWRSPAGLAWKAKRPALVVGTREVARFYWQQLWYEAGEILCEKTDCGPGALEKAPNGLPQSGPSSAPSTRTP